MIKLTDSKGEIRYGDIGDTDPLKASKAKIINGDIFSSSCSVTSETADIKEILCPISLKDLRTLRCLGLNYEQYLLPNCKHLPFPDISVLRKYSRLLSPFDLVMDI